MGHYKSFGCYSREPLAGGFIFIFVFLVEEQHDLIYTYKESFWVWDVRIRSHYSVIIKKLNKLEQKSKHKQFLDPFEK